MSYIIDNNIPLNCLETTEEDWNNQIAKPLAERAAKLAIAIRIHDGKPQTEPYTEDELQYALSLVQGYGKPPQWMAELNNKEETNQK